MKILVQRTQKTPESTPGVVFVDGVQECYSLEPGTEQDKGPIPPREYPCIVSYSSKFRRPMPLLYNVPGFVGIRIHAGNNVYDTRGCIIVGSTPENGKIFGSKAAFDKLFAMIDGALEAGNSVTVMVQDPLEI